jgi:hypothetical protein
LRFFWRLLLSCRLQNRPRLLNLHNLQAQICTSSSKEFQASIPRDLDLTNQKRNRKLFNTVCVCVCVCEREREREREIQAQWFRTTVEKKKEKKKAMTNPLQFFWRLLCPADCKIDPQLEDDETSCKMNCEKQIGETIARVLTDNLLSQSSNLHNSSSHKSLLFLFFCFRIPRWRRCNGESRSLWHGHCSESLQELGSLCAPAGMTNTQKRQP